MRLADLDYKELPVVLENASVQSLDKEASSGNIEKGFLFMEEAGKALAYKAIATDKFAVFFVFVGHGNNGGDGIVCAKTLLTLGYPCFVCLVNPEKEFQGEAKLAYESFLNAGFSFTEKSFFFKKLTDIRTNVLVIDAMLGLGLKPGLREPYKEAVTFILSKKCKVLSADVPTGFTETSPENFSLQATETLLFGFPRFQAFLKNSAEAFGKVSLAPLSYESSLIKKYDNKIYFASDTLIKKLWKEKKENIEKRDAGTALLFAGSKLMPGAAVLCANAALRSGTGLLSLAVPSEILQVLQTKLSEPVFYELKEDIEKAKIIFLKACSRNKALAIGPGLSASLFSEKLLFEILPHLEIPTVLDADALNLVSENIAILKTIKSKCILTPHQREYERLFGKLPETFSERIAHVRKCAVSFDKIILLKGSPILIAFPDERVFLVNALNVGLAKGGSGDVLTGILAALLATGFFPEEATVLAALIHQKAGKITRKKLGPVFMQPSDVIENLKEVYKEISNE